MKNLSIKNFLVFFWFLFFLFFFFFQLVFVLFFNNTLFVNSETRILIGRKEVLTVAANFAAQGFIGEREKRINIGVFAAVAATIGVLKQLSWLHQYSTATRHDSDSSSSNHWSI